MDQELINASKISGEELLSLIQASLHFWEKEEEKEHGSRPGKEKMPEKEKEREKEKEEKGTLLILLDMRSFVSYNQSHIITAINACIPQTLLKRASFCPKSIEAGISGPIGRELFGRRRGDSTLVLYEQGDELSTVGLKCFVALKKEGACQRVLILEGGFSKFQQEHPDLIKGNKNKKGTCLSTSSCPSLVPFAAAPMTAPPNLSFTLASSSSSSSSLSSSSSSSSAASASSFKAPLPQTKEEPIVPITDYLYLSGSIIAADYQTLREHKIRHIINSAEELENCFPESGDFLYTRLNLQDHPSQHMCFVKVFENAFNIIDEAKRTGTRALVHCRGGRSRSATIVIAYLMKSFRLSFQQAYEYVQSRNPKISPNLGFVGQLIRYEAYLKSGENRLLSPQNTQISPRICREESPRIRGSPYHFHLLSSGSSSPDLGMEGAPNLEHLWPHSPFPLSSHS